MVVIATASAASDGARRTSHCAWQRRDPSAARRHRRRVAHLRMGGGRSVSSATRRRALGSRARRAAPAQMPRGGSPRHRAARGRVEWTFSISTDGRRYVTAGAAARSSAARQRIYEADRAHHALVSHVRSPLVLMCTSWSFRAARRQGDRVDVGKSRSPRARAGQAVAPHHGSAHAAAADGRTGIASSADAVRSYRGATAAKE